MDDITITELKREFIKSLASEAKSYRISYKANGVPMWQQMTLEPGTSDREIIKKLLPTARRRLQEADGQQWAKVTG